MPHELETCEFPRVDRRPRVVHVVRSLEIGGLERLVCDLVRGSQQFQPAVICLTQLGAFGESLRAQGVPVTSVGMHGGPLHVLKALCSLFHKLQPAIVHCHNLQSHLFGSVSARACGIRPVVLSKHGTGFPVTSIGSRLNRRLARFSQVVAVSEEIRMLCAESFRLHPHAVHCIPNGISLQPFGDLATQSEARSRLGWPEVGYYVGIVARLVPDKGHHVLLNAFQRLHATVPAARLVIVGEGPERLRIEHAIATLQLKEVVFLLGARKDVPHILPALDVFVLPSFDEGIPMTVLEAMATALPIVATAVGGIPEVVIDGETGILVPPRSSESLAQALLNLYRHPEQAQRLAAAGRSRVTTNFDVQTTVAHYEGLYHRMIHRHS